MAENKIPVGMQDSEIKSFLVLRDLFDKTGILHDTQARYLRIWSMGMLDLAKVEARVSSDDKLLEFVGSFRTRPPQQLEYRLQYLDTCCRLLLGGSYQIQVTIGDDLIWDNSKELPWPSQTSAKKSAKSSRRGKKGTSKG